MTISKPIHTLHEPVILSLEIGFILNFLAETIYIYNP